MVVKTLYYIIKPLLPRSTQLTIRRMLIRCNLRKVKNIWPINEAAGTEPLNWPGWPEGKDFAFILTHDVETSVGIDKCQMLAKIDKSYGFKSSFNIVPYKYSVPPFILSWLKTEGFEVGVHDFNHDGKLYRSKLFFSERANKINSCLKSWNANGFRSAAMHHNLEWISDLNINYDCSTFDTDPFEPQPDAINTIFPFYYQRKNSNRGYVEIPYTLPQDFTLFVIMRERNISIWKNKLKWLAEKRGMATVIVHPDYINFDNGKPNRIDEYSLELYVNFLDHIRNVYKDRYWNPLPHELAKYIEKIESENGYLNKSTFNQSQIIS